MWVPEIYQPPFLCVPLLDIIRYMGKFIILLGIIILAGGALFYSQKQKSSSPSVIPLPGEIEKTTMTDPKNIVAKFFQNIADKKIPDAIVMMTTKAVPDDSAQQAWGVQFNAFKKLIVTSVESSLVDSWTDASQSYKVTMDVEMTPDSVNGPIPYYGYENGINIRWVTLEKENNAWKIAGISTGP
jgi:hypothetical protein